MKGILRKFETAMMAAAFAEEGEFETARELMREQEQRKIDRPTIQKRATQRKVMRAD